MLVVCEGAVPGTINRKWRVEMVMDGASRNERLTVSETSDLTFAGSRLKTDSTSERTIRPLD